MASRDVIERQGDKVQAYFEAVAAAAWAEPLWIATIRYFKSEGFGQLSYHHLPPLGAPDEGKVRVSAHGFSDAWVLRYIKEKLYRDDPIFAQASTTETPFFWNDIRKLRDLNDREDAFLGQRTEVGFHDGLAVPVFGPNGRNGYFGLGFEGPKPTLAAMYQYQAICQAGHLRYCRLQREQLPILQPLSEREIEMLQWVVRGKSNGVIADIMEISPHTVDAYLRRVFLKLGTSNRISAAVQALGSGLIRGF